MMNSLQILKARNIEALKTVAARELVDSTLPNLLTGSELIAKKVEIGTAMTVIASYADDDDISEFFHQAAVAYIGSAQDDLVEMVRHNPPNIMLMAGLDKASAILDKRKAATADDDIRYSNQPETVTTGSLPDSTETTTEQPTVVIENPNAVANTANSEHVTTAVNEKPTQTDGCAMCGKTGYKQSSKMTFAKDYFKDFKSPILRSVEGKEICGACKDKCNKIMAIEKALPATQVNMNNLDAQVTKLLQDIDAQETSLTNLDGIIAAQTDETSKKSIEKGRDDIRLSLQTNKKKYDKLDADLQKKRNEFKASMELAGLQF